jgi:hypothetical protein
MFGNRMPFHKRPENYSPKRALVPPVTDETVEEQIVTRTPSPKKMSRARATEHANTLNKWKEDRQTIYKEIAQSKEEEELAKLRQKPRILKKSDRLMSP